MVYLHRKLKQIKPNSTKKLKDEFIRTIIQLRHLTGHLTSFIGNKYIWSKRPRKLMECLEKVFLNISEEHASIKDLNIIENEPN